MPFDVSAWGDDVRHEVVGGITLRDIHRQGAKPCASTIDGVLLIHVGTAEQLSENLAQVASVVVALQTIIVAFWIV